LLTLVDITSIDDERNSAESARGIVNSLTPSTSRTDVLVVALRVSAGTAPGAMAATALNGASGLLHKRALTQE